MTGPSRFAAAVLLGAALLAPVPAHAAESRAARPPGAQLLVTLKSGNERIWAHVAEELAVLVPVRLRASWRMRSLDEQCLVLELAPGRDPDEAAARIARHARVSTVTVSHEFRVLGAGEGGGASANGGDPYAALQESEAPLRLDLAHRVSTGRGVSVALVDTGLEIEHPDLVGRVRRAHDFVGPERGSFTSELHGTAVAGVVAARAGNGVGGLGVAPDADLWALRACWHEPAGGRGAVCDSYTLAQALDFAIVERARVVNLSLTGTADPLLERLIAAALEHGAVVVAAAEGEPAGFPASLPGVIAVHGWAKDRPRPASERDLGAESLVAPAVDILTTVPKSGFDFVSGSSFSAAQVSGVVALLLERSPELTAKEIRALLQSSGSAVEGAEGPRLVDACGALAAALGGELCARDADHTASN